MVHEGAPSHQKGCLRDTARKGCLWPSEWEKIIANEATDKTTNLKNIQATPTAQLQKNK